MTCIVLCRLRWLTAWQSTYAELSEQQSELATKLRALEDQTQACEGIAVDGTMTDEGLLFSRLLLPLSAHPILVLDTYPHPTPKNKNQHRDASSHC